jgi:hypothetical protein
MPLTRNPIRDELFSVRCLRVEVIDSGFGGFGPKTTKRSRDYEHLIFRGETSDETFVVGTPVQGSMAPTGKPILLRREDFEFSRVSPEVAVALGLEQIPEPQVELDGEPLA